MDVARRWFVTAGTATAVLAATPRLAAAQSAGRVSRVAVVWAVPAAAGAPYRVILEQSLRELGWIEGHNIVFDHRFPESRENVLALAEEAVKTRPDIIVAATNLAIAAAARATSTIPIVMMWGYDPVGSRFALSMARPGKNVTGLVGDPGLEFFSKQMELVKQFLPNSDRLLVFRRHDAEVIPQVRSMVSSVDAAARTLGLRLEVSGVRVAADIERAFDQVDRSRPSAVFAFYDSLIFVHMALIAKLALRYRLPSFFFYREGVEAGGLASYGTDVKAPPRDAATFVDKILRGAKPAELPIEQPARFVLAINLKTAKALGLTIPQSVVFRADHIIE